MQTELKSILRSDFLAFARKAIFELDGTAISDDRYIEHLATALMQFDEGRVRRLVINLPPRHLKTMLCTISLVAWMLAHNPKLKILVVTYSADLAESISRNIRSILRARWFKETFKTRLQKGHEKIADFATTAGGLVYASSIDGNITGRGGDVIVFDDPHNIADAGNPKRLALTLETFDSVLKGRLNNRKAGKIMVVAHRIHEDDLSSHLLSKPKWSRVVLPLIAPCDEVYETADGPWHRYKGEVLRPDDEDMDEIEDLKLSLVNPDFEMHYQQDCQGQALPSINAADFRECTENDYRGLDRVISIDTGVNDSEEGSFSVIQVWASDGICHYLIDQFRERCEFRELARMTHRFCKRHRAKQILIEHTANGPALISQLTPKQGRRVIPICPRGRKSARLMRHVDDIKSQRIRLLRDAPFRSTFVGEFVSFPHGRHTDQIDAFTQYLDWFREFGEFPVPCGSETPRVNGVVSFNSQPNLNGLVDSSQPSNIIARAPGRSAFRLY